MRVGYRHHGLTGPTVMVQARWGQMGPDGFKLGKVGLYGSHGARWVWMASSMNHYNARKAELN